VIGDSRFRNGLAPEQERLLVPLARCRGSKFGSRSTSQAERFSGCIGYGPWTDVRILRTRDRAEAKRLAIEFIRELERGAKPAPPSH